MITVTRFSIGRRRLSADCKRRERGALSQVPFPHDQRRGGLAVGTLTRFRHRITISSSRRPISATTLGTYSPTAVGLGVRRYRQSEDLGSDQISRGLTASTTKQLYGTLTVDTHDQRRMKSQTAPPGFGSLCSHRKAFRSRVLTQTFTLTVSTPAVRTQSPLCGPDVSGPERSKMCTGGYPTTASRTSSLAYNNAIAFGSATGRATVERAAPVLVRRRTWSETLTATASSMPRPQMK